MELQDPITRPTSGPATRRRPAGVALLVVAAALLAGACSDGDGGSTTTSSTTGTATSAGDGAAEPGVLFVVSAASGTSDGDEITLVDVDEWVTMFADRPARTGTRLAIRDFADSWSSFGFDEDPPNAAITFLDGGAQRTVVAELRDPTVVDTGTGTELRAAYTLAEGQPALPATFERPDAFIDDAVAPTLTTDLPGPDGGRVEADLIAFGTFGVMVNAELTPGSGPGALADRYLSAYLLPSAMALSEADLGDATAIRASLAGVVAAHRDGAATGPESSSPVPYTYGGRSFALEAPIGPGSHAVLVVAAARPGLDGVDATTDAVAVVRFEVGAPS